MSAADEGPSGTQSKSASELDFTEFNPQELLQEEADQIIVRNNKIRFLCLSS